MEFGGFEKCTLIDYPGKIACMVYTIGCNFRCPYCHNAELVDETVAHRFSEKEILGFLDGRKKMLDGVVITGGEPTMYLSELESLCKGLKKINGNMVITIETNGTCIGDFIKYADLISISPKLISSVPFNTEFEKMHLKNRINIEVLRKYNSLQKTGDIDIQWKFVFTGNEDIKEILNLQVLIGFENKDIYLMPEGITKEDLRKNRYAAIKACLSNQFNYTDRIHILVWGNKRGV